MRPIGGIGVKVSEERVCVVDEAGVVYVRILGLSEKVG